MTGVQAFKEIESAALAYANGATPERVQRIGHALEVLKSRVRCQAPVPTDGVLSVSPKAVARPEGWRQTSLL